MTLSPKVSENAFVSTSFLKSLYIEKYKNPELSRGVLCVERGNMVGFVSFQIQRDALIPFICLHYPHIINKPEVSTDKVQKECRLTPCLRRSEYSCAWAVLTGVDVNCFHS